MLEQLRLQRDPSPQKDQYAEIYRDQSKYAENLKRREREKSEKNRKAREEADYKQKLVSLQTKLDITTPPAPKRFISGYFPRGGLSIVVAAPGTGKTWFILRIACDLSIGGPIFDGFAEEARPLKSLIFAGEAGSELLLHRVYDTHWDFNMDNITIIDMINAENDGVSLMFDTEAGRRNIEIFISENKPDIVFFDTFGSFHSHNESKSSEMRSIIRFLTGLAQKYDVAVVVTHHTRKSGSRAKKNPLTQDDSLGSIAITGNASVVVAIESFPKELLDENGMPIQARSTQMQSILEAEDRAESKIMVVKVVKTWYKDFSPFTFSLADDDGKTRMLVDLMPTFSSEKRETLRDLLLQYLRKTYAENQWFKSSDIPTNFLGNEDMISARHIIRLLVALSDEGEIKRKGFGRNTVYSNVSSRTSNNKPLQI